MRVYFILVPILVPILTGCLMLFFPFADSRKRNLCVEAVVLVNSFLTFWLLLHHQGDSLYLFSLSEALPLTLKIDGMAVFFGALVAALWPLASLYAFEYMRHEERVNTFLAFYTMTYGVTLGVAFSGNIITMYLFYETLTMVTLPLVIHTMTREARQATRKYLYYMIGGTAFAFIGIVFYSLFCQNMDFIYGGSLDVARIGNHVNVVLFIYVLMFFGFGIKAAIFPFQGWLPSASVAPTPVTALLHAVAVVKSGVFAVMRVTYFCFGADFLKGTWAQTVVMLAAMVTIVYASTMGVKEDHLKRRLAYSTVSNLSYILLGAAAMSPLGLLAGLSHMLMHAVMKISAFFCAGAVMHQTEKNYVHELDGLGYRMPVTFAALFVSGMSLIGIPLFAGFVSKWNIVKALLEHTTVVGCAGVAVLLYSALMTGIYMLVISIRAWFPKSGYDPAALQKYKDPNWMMKLPLLIFTAATVLLGVHAQPVLGFIEKIAAGAL